MGDAVGLVAFPPDGGRLPAEAAVQRESIMQSSPSRSAAHAAYQEQPAPGLFFSQVATDLVSR